MRPTLLRSAHFSRTILTIFACAVLFFLAQPVTVSAQEHASSNQPKAVGPNGVIVQSIFGGQIFGFDIDQNGSEGVLTEAQTQPDGTVLAAVETFDQATGNIVKVVKKSVTKDDFLTLGIVGNGVGLVEREHVKDIFVASRIYRTMDPLSSNAFTGRWTPPLTKDDIILGISRNQGIVNSAVLAFHNGGDDHTFVFRTNIRTNTTGPLITLTDPTFFFANGPIVAYDSKKNRAVVAASDGTVGGPAPVIAFVNLTTGVINEFLGVAGPPPFGQGFINGMALDSDDGIAATTTEVDFAVEFYDLKTKTGFRQVLPGATGQLQSGSDVAYDPLNKLFFVAQSVSSTGSGSSIHVYDIHGNLLESLDGFNFSNESAVIRTHIALNPANRSGYVDGPEVTQLQMFTY